MELICFDEFGRVGTWTKVANQRLAPRSRRFHYSFELDSGHTGFVLHKKSSRRSRIRLFLDANENGRFDRKDPLLVGGVLKKPFSTSRRSSLMRRSDVGVITAKKHVMHDHSAHDHDHHHDHDHDHDHHLVSKGPVGINAIGYEHMSLWTEAMAEVFHDHGAAHHHDSMMM